MAATYPAETHPAGTLLDYSTDGGSTYTNLADVVKLTPPKLKKSVGKKTKLNATSLAASKMRGWVECEPCKATIQFKGSTFPTLKTLFLKGPQDTYEVYRIKLPLLADGTATNATLIWTGFISELPFSEAAVDTDQVYESEITIEVDGLFVFTAAS